jgi:hypothetical protein
MDNQREIKPKGGWVLCEKCGKKLLKRKPNGTFVLKFGRNSKQEDVIHLEVFGSLKMKCFRESCGHLNTINFFPS